MTQCPLTNDEERNLKPHLELAHEGDHHKCGLFDNIHVIHHGLRLPRTDVKICSQRRRSGSIYIFTITKGYYAHGTIHFTALIGPETPSGVEE
jgi:hypothetical protein